MPGTTGENTSRTGSVLPLDLLVVVAVYVLAGVTVFVPALARAPVRPVFGFVFAVFVPGYVLVAILFPRHRPEEGRTAPSTSPQPRGLGPVARVVFSFGASLAVVTLVGLALGATALGIRPVTLFVALSALVVPGVALAAYRRRDLPADQRVGAWLARGLGRGFDGVVSPETTRDAVLNVVLVAVVLVSSAVVVYGGPPQGGEITEFALLSQGEDGEFGAREYPSTLQRGEPRNFSVRVGNHEGKRVSYTVVLLLRELGPENSTVVATSKLDRFRKTVEDNETWRLDHSVVPDRAGENLQLQYLLYKGETPERPSLEGAYRELHLWVDVTE